MLKKTIAGGAVILSISFGALLAQDKGKGGGRGGPKGPGLTLNVSRSGGRGRHPR